MLLVFQLLTMAGTPFRPRTLVPCDEPKFAPVIVTESPKFPEVGATLVILGASPTTNGTPLLVTPFTATTILPFEAPDGTGTVMLLLLQVVGAAVKPLNFTVLVPCVPPKLDPLIVMAAPTGATTGETLLITGGVPTVNGTPLLGAPLTITVTFPVVAAAGTSAVITLLFQLVVVAVVPLKATVLFPCVKPKLVPVMVTAVPGGPWFGERFATVGAGIVNKAPLLGVPFTVTITFPVLAPNGTSATTFVSLQLLIVVAWIPLKLTVLLPWVAPKLKPEMFTIVLMGPALGVRLEIRAWAVNGAPLLGCPFTVTTMLPDVTAVGAGTVIMVLLQVVGLEGAPLNVTVLLPCSAPKFVPLMVTVVPCGAALGERLLMTGGVFAMVKGSALLVCPSAVTVTLPDVAPAGTSTIAPVSIQL
jgi:hypothetical protein